jgi:hypothetical protein
MSRKSERQKSKRRADKLAVRAWDAVEQGDVQLARKIIKRATDERPANPLLWHDLGLISELHGDEAAAEKALQNALFLAPDFVNAHTQLAALYARQGKLAAAERLQKRAASLAPNNKEVQETLAVYRLLLPSEPEPANLATVPPGAEEFRLDRYDWMLVSKELQTKGCSLLPGLLDPAECRDFSGLYRYDRYFEKTIAMSAAQGNGCYRFFTLPLPLRLGQLRAEIYAKLAPIANEWNGLLRKEGFFYPPSLSEFTAHCREAGQTRTTPILLYYETGGFNALHQDVWGDITFPFQLVVTLSEAFTGGEFLLAEEAPGRKSLRVELAATQGDGIVFCGQHRLVKFGDGFALRSIWHGLKTITSGERFALGIPFHEYKG